VRNKGDEENQTGVSCEGAAREEARFKKRQGGRDIDHADWTLHEACDTGYSAGPWSEKGILQKKGSKENENALITSLRRVCSEAARSIREKIEVKTIKKKGGGKCSRGAASGTIFSYLWGVALDVVRLE